MRPQSCGRLVQEIADRGLRFAVAAGLLLAWGCLGSIRATEAWEEIRSPHFTVVSNAGASQARQTAARFELLRGVVREALPAARLDGALPLSILAVRDEEDLKALLPGFWEKEGRKHPSGIFVSGPEKDYVALRLDAPGASPYETIFHEYIHGILRANFRRLPLWLNEGLAEVFAHSSFERDEARLGRPVARHLDRLRSGATIPLDALLTADRSSPYYDDAGKAPSFYAQSWQLAHYLLLGDRGANRAALAEYLALLDRDAEPLEAAKKAFGELKGLSQRLDAYARQTQFYSLPVRVPVSPGGGGFAARELPLAESLAVRGDFHVHMGRDAEARALLGEALRLAPELPAARESMGLLFLREGSLEEALRWFSEAARLDSRSFLAHYYEGVALAREAASPKQLAAAEASLRRSLELNPNFAASYGALAQLCAARPGGIEEALGLARKAVDLEPGSAAYRLNLAAVLLRMGRPAAARDAAEQAQAAARSPQEKEAAEGFLRQLGRTRP